MKSLPGWKIYIDEISNGVFKVTLTDAYGRKAEITDVATNKTIDLAKSYAFDIEKQISQNWNKFLYDLFLQEVDNLTIIRHEYNDQAFGSWYFEFENKRLVLDGKDYLLNSQSRVNNEWNDNEDIGIKELTYYKYLDFIHDVTQ
jgi:hypothetical protein